jgi:hypothetical protein
MYEMMFWLGGHDELEPVLRAYSNGIISGQLRRKKLA